MSTVTSVSATLSMVSKTRRIAGLAPTMLLEAEDAVHLLEEPAVVAPEERRLHHAPHDDAQLVVVEGLRQVVGGAELHRLHGDLLRAVAR